MSHAMVPIGIGSQRRAVVAHHSEPLFNLEKQPHYFKGYLSMSANNTRPIITTLQITADMSAAEMFQNSTLRPIIKMKHDLFIDYLLEYLAAKKNPLSSLGREKRILYLASVFQQDRNLRSELRGVVLGHLTTDEYQQYAKMKSEMNKRIINIIKNRMVDNIDLLSESRLASV